jgi:hypothetical protein
MPPLTSDDYPIIEIGWQFPASIEAFHKLEAFQLITGEPLETEVYGAKLVLITTWNQMIAAQFFLNCDKQVCDVLTSIIGTCNRDELERIVFQTTDEIKHMYWKETEV